MTTRNIHTSSITVKASLQCAFVNKGAIHNKAAIDGQIACVGILSAGAICHMHNIDIVGATSVEFTGPQVNNQAIFAENIIDKLFFICCIIKVQMCQAIFVNRQQWGQSFLCILILVNNCIGIPFGNDVAINYSALQNIDVLNIGIGRNIDSCFFTCESASNIKISHQFAVDGSGQVLLYPTALCFFLRFILG